MMTFNNPMVTEYLNRLHTATADLPSGEREELVASISEHISTSLAELDHPSESDIRAVLSRLGDPVAIAAEARGQSSGYAPTPLAAPDKPGALEWGGVVVLGVGSYLIPIIGTVVGLVMISLSSWWSTRQKVLAAVLSLSGAIVLPVVLAGLLLVGPGDNAPPPTPVVNGEPLDATRSPR